MSALGCSLANRSVCPRGCYATGGNAVCAVLNGGRFDGHLTRAAQDVKALAWHPSGEVLVSASYDDSIKLWTDSGDEWECAQTLSGTAATICVTWTSARVFLDLSTVAV